MELFKNMKISTKLVTLTGILGALILVTAVCFLCFLSSVSEQYQKVYDEDAYAATLATQAGKIFTESRNEYTRFLTRVDPVMRQEAKRKQIEEAYKKGIAPEWLKLEQIC